MDNIVQDKIEFQEDTINRIMSFYYPAYNGPERGANLSAGSENERGAYLLADETGLGKTIVAREIIKKMYDKKRDGKKQFRVVYICSNMELAKKNIKKLVDDIEDSCVSEVDRLSKVSKELIEPNYKPFKAYKVTPLSFDCNGGDKDEYTLCYELYEEYRRRNGNNKNEINKNGHYKEILDEFFKIATEGDKKNLDDICRKVENIFKLVEGEGAERGDEHFKYNEKEIGLDKYSEKDTRIGLDWDCVDMSDGNNEKCIEALSELFAEHIMEPIRRWEKANCDQFNIYGGYNEEYLNYILGNEEIPDNKNRLRYIHVFRMARDYNNMLKETLKDIGESVKDNGEICDVVKSWWEKEKPWYNKEEYKKKYQNIYNKFECNLKKTIKIILKNNPESDFEKCIFYNVMEIADRQIFVLQRKMATLISLKLMDPDLVIIDELQNYPQLFKDRDKKYYSSQSSDKEEHVDGTGNHSDKKYEENAAAEEVRLVMDTILDDKNNKRKVLMLSATPYSYKNSINANDTDDDSSETEEDVFLKHVVGIEEIINYISEKNNVDGAGIVKQIKRLDGYEDGLDCVPDNEVDVFKIWKKLYEQYNELIREMKNNNEGKSRSDSLGNKYKLYTKAIGTLLRSIGISRVERDMVFNEQSYECTEGLGILDAADITFSDMYYHNIEEKNERLNMSVSHIKENYHNLKEKPYCYDYGEIREYSYEENSRINRLFDKLHINNQNKLLFIPPTKPHYELSGEFKENSNYSKTILFSARNIIPIQLGEMANNIIHEGDDGKSAVTIEEINEQTKRLYEQAKRLYEEYNGPSYTDLIVKKRDQLSPEEIQYMGSIYAYFADNYLNKNGNNECIETICKAIYKYFLSDHARSIIMKCRSASTYVEKLHEYCYSGNIRAVLDEFIYLYMSDRMMGLDKWKDNAKRNLDDLAAHISGTEKFANIHSSVKASLDDNTCFENVTDHFQSPFYPFVLMMTSVAQEGFDFHWYCNRIIHWNVPSTPIAFIQREGRIDRYNSFGVRKNLCARIDEIDEKGIGLEQQGTIAVWNEMFEKVVTEEGGEADYREYKGLFPHWVMPFENKDKTKTSLIELERGTLYYKYSEEYFRWEKLMRELHYYKGLLGTVPIDFELAEEVMKEIKDIKIDLYPYINNN